MSAPSSNSVSTEFEDGADISYSPSNSKGTIKISRGFFEYSFSDVIILSVGKILTPFGMLNEVHDFSITFLPIEMPLPYRAIIPNGANGYARTFSKYSTGASLKIATNAGNHHWVNQLTLSNGSNET